MHEYQQKIPTCPQNAPQKWEQIYYGAKNQWAPNESDKNILPPEDRKYIQKLVGTFIYYARVVKPTTMVELGTLAATQSIGKEHTKYLAAHLLDYRDTKPDAKLIYHSRNMISRIHNDA